MKSKASRVNSLRRKRIRNFMDKNHEVMDRYYETIEDPLDEELANKMLLLIDEDPDFYDPYLMVAEYLESCGELKKAFEKAREKGGIVGTSIGELPKVQS